MSKRQQTLPGIQSPRRITKRETFGAVQLTFLKILKQRGHATADVIREYLDIPKPGLPAIGRAISHLHKMGLIEDIGFTLSQRTKAHARPLRIWRLTVNQKSPTNGLR